MGAAEPINGSSTVRSTDNRRGRGGPTAAVMRFCDHKSAAIIAEASIPDNFSSDFLHADGWPTAAVMNLCECKDYAIAVEEPIPRRRSGAFKEGRFSF